MYYLFMKLQKCLLQIKSHLDVNEHEQHFAAAMSNIVFDDRNCSQTDFSISESVSIQTDFSVGESVGVQTDFSVGEMVDARINSSVGIQTDSLVGKSMSVQTDPSVGESVSVQTNTCYHQTVGVQTNFNGLDDSSERASGEEDYSPIQGISIQKI